MADLGASTTNEDLRRAQNQLVSLIVTQPFTYASSPPTTAVPPPPTPAAAQERSPFTQAVFPSPFSYLPHTEFSPMSRLMGALDGSALPPYQNQPTTGTAIPNWPTDDQLANQASMISLPHDVMSFFEPSSSSDLLASTAAPIVNLGPASGQTSVNPSLSPSISAVTMPSLAEFAEYLVETVVADASSEKEVLDSGSPGRALVAPEDVTSETVVALPTWTESAREMTSNQENTPSSPPDTNAARLLAPSWISSALKFIGLERRTQKEEVHRSTNVDASSSKSRYSPYPARPGMFDTPKSDRSPLGEIQLPRNQPLIRRADHVPRQRKLKKLEAYVPTRRKFKKTLNEFIPKQRQMRRLKKDFDIPKEN